MQTEITISVSPKAATEKESIKLCSARKLNIDVNSISDIKVHKRSIDARSRNIKIHLKVTVFSKGEVAIPKNYQKVYKNVKILVCLNHKVKYNKDKNLRFIYTNFKQKI